ncbi:hypothetical protein SC09_Contig24orf00633 [Bacillus subtilis]|uniref:Uncharacterized protein n=1 Tax=Bacillus subtilis TaxID=1423 RepID=A0A0D1IQK5_BACIU|nr:hypothetical protein SC09_Contig24orf00633 [Bacillus subtilis]
MEHVMTAAASSRTNFFMVLPSFNKVKGYAWLTHPSNDLLTLFSNFLK